MKTQDHLKIKLDPQDYMSVAEEFLNRNYYFRRNVLSGKVEYITKKAFKEAEAGEEPWEILTTMALNSIIVRAKRENLDELCKPKIDITELIYSSLIREYNPIESYLKEQQHWDGTDHVRQLFNRLPGLTEEHHIYLAIWLRSAVAHWLQMDMLHANETVPTLIGAQGCGKSTFMARLLPKHLRMYYLDHINLSNKFDKEMALTNNLLVNLDELDAIRPSQHASLKQTLSKSKVNGRVIYGKTQEDRIRFASFVATTNNPHPLSDVTGSRRYICITIPRGEYIDNEGEINYDQLFAQVMNELNVQHLPYWFSNEQVLRLQELNTAFMDQKDLAEIISLHFRKPLDGEPARTLSSTDIIRLIQKEYPTVKSDHSTKVHLGMALKDLGYNLVLHSNVRYYKIVPLITATA